MPLLTLGFRETVLPFGLSSFLDRLPWKKQAHVVSALGRSCLAGQGPEAPSPTARKRAPEPQSGIEVTEPEATA